MLRHLPSFLAVFAVVAASFGHQNSGARAAPELPPGERVLWIDPGDSSLFDFKYGPGGRDGQPRPPFHFIDEDMSGTSPKVNVMDARGRTWNVKWGPEVSSSTFCTRLVWACGYYAEPEYFVRLGRIEGAHDLKRAKSYVSKDGYFMGARFQLRTGLPKFLDGQSWAWTNNPFLHTRELQGLKILMLLVSNWDTKDARDEAHGRMDSNLSIFVDDSTGVRRYLYADSDWGATLGKWGNLLTWDRWNCEGFAEQTPSFVKGVHNGWLQWGFNGKHRKDMTGDISIYDVQWILQYLGRITDAQIRIGLEASGATPEEVECYSKSLRERIEQLQQAAAQAPAQSVNAAARRQVAFRHPGIAKKRDSSSAFLTGRWGCCGRRTAPRPPSVRARGCFPGRCIRIVRRQGSIAT
jgi:hypothetical protein